MDRTQLVHILQAHNVDASSLELVLSRGDEHIYQLTVSAREAVERWHALRSMVDEIRHWPVLGWGRHWLDNVSVYRTQLETGSTSAILVESEQVDLAQWQQARIDEYLEVLQDDEEEGESDFFADVEGEWPNDVAPTTTFSIPEDAATRGPQPQLEIALVPTTASWQVPAYLRFDTLLASPAVHTAMARHWADVYGANIIGMLPDLIEMHVSRPPTTRDAALALAKEQYIYCMDIVIQGTQTVQRLAASLLNGTAWFFWWD